MFFVCLYVRYKVLEPIKLKSVLKTNGKNSKIFWRLNQNAYKAKNTCISGQKSLNLQMAIVNIDCCFGVY